MLEPTRVGLIVWVKHLKDAHKLDRFGHVLYVSRRMKYVHLYVKASEVEKKMAELSRMPWVSRVERSHRHEIPVEYNKKAPLD